MRETCFANKTYNVSFIATCWFILTFIFIMYFGKNAYDLQKESEFFSYSWFFFLELQRKYPKVSASVREIWGGSRWNLLQ